jgi:hypothetical protein
MTRPTDERPFPRERELASKEEESSDCGFLPHPKTFPQSTTTRMLIGARWIGLTTGTEEFDANDVCVRRHSGAWRTRDVDEAARIWRATAATIPIEIFITPKGRECGRGIELAVELRQRGVSVTFDPVNARKDELDWVDGGALEDLPPPDF